MTNISYLGGGMPGRFTINHGDCLEIMKGMPVGTQFDAVITDPPYMVGAISVGNSGAKAGTWADMENSAYWFSAWMRECRRLLKPDGYLITFGNWRSIPTLIRALSLADLSASCCMIWDKQWIGPAGPQQLRPRYELAIFAAMPDAKIDDRCAPDIYACKWLAGNMKTTEHPAEKPVDLIRHMIRLVTKPGATVLDPFTGSGTTGVACIAEGRCFVGIEREAEWVRVGLERCATEAAQGKDQSIFDAAAIDVAMPANPTDHQAPASGALVHPVVGRISENMKQNPDGSYSEAESL